LRQTSENAGNEFTRKMAEITSSSRFAPRVEPERFSGLDLIQAAILFKTLSCLPFTFATIVALLFRYICVEHEPT